MSYHVETGDTTPLAVLGKFKPLGLAASQVQAVPVPAAVPPPITAGVGGGGLKTMLLLAAAGAAAYFLFFRGRKHTNPGRRRRYRKNPGMRECSRGHLWVYSGSGYASLCPKCGTAGRSVRLMGGKRKNPLRQARVQCARGHSWWAGWSPSAPAPRCPTCGWAGGR
jgi:hypothetical protein